MSKHCILINGTMGVGKTTVCKELMKLLPASVFLDGTGAGTAILLPLPNRPNRLLWKISVLCCKIF